MKAVLLLLCWTLAQYIPAGSHVPIGIATIVSTIFDEGTPGTAITGTSPAVNVHGNLWLIWNGLAVPLQFSATGAKSPSPNCGNEINTGAPSYTVTFSGMTNTATTVTAFSGTSTLSDRMEIWTLGTGGIALKETVGGTTTQLQTQAVANGATGSIVAVVNGTSITVTAFGQSPMTYTIPSGHADIGGPYVGMLTSALTGYSFGGVKVTVP